MPKTKEQKQADKERRRALQTWLFQAGMIVAFAGSKRGRISAVRAQLPQVDALLAEMEAEAEV